MKLELDRQQNRDRERAASPRRQTSSKEPPEHVVLQLQEQVGNRAVSQSLRSGFGEEHGRKESSLLQMARAACSSAGNPTRIPATPGIDLGASTRRSLEAHFGADLAAVRVHTDREAAESASRMNALAYTSGRDIYFAEGMYAPASSSGQRLLAHEVAHVVQQSSGKEPLVPMKSTGGVKIGAPDDALEIEAQRKADEFLSGAQPVGITDGKQRTRLESSGAAQRFIQRQVMPHVGPAAPVSSKCPPFPATTVEELTVWGSYDWAPDPNDPFEQPPIDWGAWQGIELNGPPPAFVRASFTGPKPEPKPYINCGVKWDQGLEQGSVMPRQRKKADDANDAFQKAYETLANNCEKAYPKITEFVDVRQALAGDLHDILGFKVVPGAQDLGAVTLGQSEKGVALADIFKGKQGTGTKANVDTSKAAMAKASEPANSEDLAEARRRVNTENKNVWARTQHLLNLEDSARQAGEGVALAIRNVELQKRKLVASNLAWELYKLNQQKIAIAEDIETASKLIAVGLNVGLATLDPHEALELGIDAALELGTVCVNTYYREHMEEKIKKLDDAVKGANLQINAEEFELVGYGAVQEAQKKSVTVKEVQLAKEDLTIALGRAQSAYTDFAKLAGQFAGGSPQNRELVESAIIAIPKVEYLVGTIATVILLIGEPPTYSEIAGIGYRANLAVAGESFSVHYPLLKGYQRKFYNEYTLWTERLESLKAVANAFAPAPSGGPELTPPVQIPQVGDFPESLPGEQPNLKYG